MKVTVEIHDDAVDKMVIAELKRTLGWHTSKFGASHDPDSPEIAAACKRLIKYYGPPQCRKLSPKKSKSS